MSAVVRAVLRVGLVPIIAAWVPFELVNGVPSELINATTAEEKFNIVATTRSLALLESLPEELAGLNLTLDNFRKYFNITVDYHGPALTTRPNVAAPRRASSKLASSGDPVPLPDPTKLINVFKSTWDFVKNNEGVANIAEGNYASAIPDGVGWSSVSFPQEPTV